MVDNNFYINKGPFLLSRIAEYLSIEVQNAPSSDILIKNLQSINSAGNDEIIFLNNAKYDTKLLTSKAAAAIIPFSVIEKITTPDNMALLISKNSYYDYARLLELFYQPKKPYNKIQNGQLISPSAKIGNNCYIGHNVVIEDEVEIGDNCIINHGVHIDFGVKIGPECTLGTNSSISFSIIGNNVNILPGARIGQDGFGFAEKNGTYKKIFHVGRVIIGNNVEIGANTTIDRGSLDDTIIEDWCRIDNLVQIAHNVKIGKGSIIVAQVGIAGSSEIGQYCALGGQVGVSGHLNIGDHAKIVAQSGIMKDIPANESFAGTPAVPVKNWHRQTIALKKLITK